MRGVCTAVLAVCLLAAGPAAAAELTQWAVDGTASSEYGSSYSAMHAAGEPAVYPEYGSSTGVWYSRSASAGPEWLELAYAEAVWLHKVEIYETDGPGAIVGLEIYDPAGERLRVWTGDPEPDLPGEARVFTIEVERQPFSVDRIRLLLDTRAVSGWTGIDAVAITGTVGALLELGTVGRGTLTRIPDEELYPFGERVELQAVAEPGWSFAAWAGDAAGSEPGLSVVMERDRAVTAVFTQDRYGLSLHTRGEGTIVHRPEQARYLYGEEITLSAHPAAGWRFSHWVGDLQGEEGRAAVVLEGDLTATAVFIPRQHAVALDVEGTGTVHFMPDQDRHPHGSPVGLVAVPAEGWLFAHWEGDVTGTDNPALLLADGEKNVRAVFTEAPEFALDYRAWEQPIAELASLEELDGAVVSFADILAVAIERRAGHPTLLDDLGKVLERLQAVQEAITTELAEQAPMP